MIKINDRSHIILKSCDKMYQSKTIRKILLPHFKMLHNFINKLIRHEPNVTHNEILILVSFFPVILLSFIQNVATYW